METWAIIIDIMLLAEVLILFFALYRNEWVFRNRIDLIMLDYSKYKTLPSYESMVWGDRFWVFDINSYLDNKR